MDTYTITEECKLPSQGKLYTQEVKPLLKIRSMTTNEEMLRLGHSERPNQLLSEIIDECLIEKPGISSYDMCVGDFQYLLHRLRVATYGSDYKIETVCPICGASNKGSVNLDSLNILEYTEDLDKYINITLPKTGKQVKLRMQTPRLMEDVALRVKEQQRKTPEVKGNPAFLFTLEAVIEKIDNNIPDPITLTKFVRGLPMMDANYILQCMKKLDSMVGIENKIPCECKECGAKYISPFPFTGEFFGPSID